MGRGGLPAKPPVPPKVCTPILPALHGAAGVGRDLWGPVSPTTPPPSLRQAPEPPQEFSDVASLPESTHSKRGSLV